MAGTKGHGFIELISPYLRERLLVIEQRYGKDSPHYHALARQYFKDAAEDDIHQGERRRHYEAESHLIYDSHPLIGVERLYRRTLLIEPTTVCAAHCRWCLRGQYPVQTMSHEDISRAARYCGASENRNDVDEVLITGGDPLMSLPLLGLTLSELQRHAPNVRTVRIGSRVPFQDPRRVDQSLIDVFERYPEFDFEIGTHVNHPVEFCELSTAAIARLINAGIKVYNQHPILKGVNDDFDILCELYDLIRQNSIEAHYAFHAIPLKGMSHHRTSLAKALKLVTRLSSSGHFSGRAKPHLAVLSDIGKIVLYEGVIKERNLDTNEVLLTSGFKAEERKRWNPSWTLPKSARHNGEGFLDVWYLDGCDDQKEEQA